MQTALQLENNGAQLSVERRLAFILAGHAKFTVVSRVTGTRFTYRVTAAKHVENNIHNLWFVSVLNGPDNQANYTYLGMIGNQFNFSLTSKSSYRWGTPSLDAFYWVWTHLASNDFEFWHAGECGRCGRELTDPESIQRGLGPVCAEKG